MSGSPWVGIIPARIAHGSESTNDSYDVTYTYFKGVTYKLISLRNPGAGSWSVRMHTSDRLCLYTMLLNFS